MKSAGIKTDELAKCLYERYGKIHHENDYSQITWEAIGYMVKDEYLKDARKILDTFAFNDMYKALKDLADAYQIDISETDLTYYPEYWQNLIKAIRKVEGR